MKTVESVGELGTDRRSKTAVLRVTPRD